jgi:hypothetical protein
MVCDLIGKEDLFCHSKNNFINIQTKKLNQFFTLDDFVGACFSLAVKRVGDRRREGGLDEADCKY